MFDFFPRNFATCSKPPSRENHIVKRLKHQGRNNVTRARNERNVCMKKRISSQAVTTEIVFVLNFVHIAQYNCEQHTSNFTHTLYVDLKHKLYLLMVLHYWCIFLAIANISTVHITSFIWAL